METNKENNGTSWLSCQKEGHLCLKTRVLPIEKQKLKPPIENLVFLAESCVNIRMVIRYNRAVGGKHIVGYSPLNKPNGSLYFQLTDQMECLIKPIIQEKQQKIFSNAYKKPRSPF